MKFFAKMDSKGRIRIPKEIMDLMQYENRTLFEVTLIERNEKKDLLAKLVKAGET